LKEKHGMVKRNRCLGAILLLALLIGIGASPTPGAAGPLAQMDCTFTVKYPIVSVRSGPGTEYDRVGALRYGQTFDVIDQAVGRDGFVWWKGTDDRWVRSDLGNSDCPATCGNAVCEHGETSSSCAQDCQTTTPASRETLSSTGTGCLVSNCQSCYESISCYPSCSECTCSHNEYGCITCYCRYPGNRTSSTGTGCLVGDCQSCYESISCYPSCSECTCSRNEYGCPTCYCRYPASSSGE
jgi:hypothetical protein